MHKSNTLELFPATTLLTGEEATEARQQRGLKIAALARIEKQGGFYIVPSQTSPRPTKYKVSYSSGHQTCTCPDFEARGCKCKHIYAVQYTLEREQHSDGSATVTESLTVTEQRRTSPQNWPAYNAAQQNEKREFQTLLADLCKGIVDPTDGEKPGRGRPAFPLRDAVFAAVYKVYSTFSGRRFTSDLCEAQGKGFIGRVPHYNTAFKYMESAELFPILLSMIERASLPLRSVESNFAVDSTGFAFCRFTRWYDIKYNRFTSEQQWVKAHFMCGVKTNVVTAIEIHGMHEGDAKQLPALVATTAQNFTVKEVSADKGYSGRECHDAIDAVGAVPFIAFKSNTTGGVGGLFKKMFHYFSFRRDDFLAHYHQRSNIESTVMMIKSKFGDAVRSKSETAARNEVLCKVLCHNVCCLISAMYELGIQPELFAGDDAHKTAPLPTN
jgi:transposase